MNSQISKVNLLIFLKVPSDFSMYLQLLIDNLHLILIDSIISPL